ncbi:TPA: ATP-binding protein [Serratia marcescens]|uniref:ATP-binding protein n=10 Tax=Gammaproteobacteria TaxID=1236 RepID=A0A855VZM0_9ENTR|nr:MULTISPECIES: AAA family ATPase [Gammaproteobacteria]AVO81479.1 ATP-binding protein [Enterobacter cloacae complex sp.]EKT9721502.1 AAA family ATPase [Klebsiella variicola]EKU0399639.1 AAA family ATPase [Citrobacter freundii]EKW2141737.1 AAA family ATPase [Citrobacter braakii]MCU2955230.1 AAA family ATPase [Enterobacter hormaechei subsp. hoffmannii]MDS6630144.1 AAA family ATPase [Klebsiella michiganensis]HAT3729865.1 AAA family ATPase [Serratia marcescens]
MEVKNLTLHNIGRFKHLEIPLAPLGYLDSNVTVFVGNNGSGKTSILKALATSLSWLVSRIQSETGKGSPIPELVIKNKTSSAAIDINIFNHVRGNPEDGDLEGLDDNYFPWRIAKARKGRKGEHKSDFWGATALADHYRKKLSNDEKSSLPLIAFYSVERVVIDIPLKIRGKHEFFQLNGYENSLTQGVDFRRFFEWFREREDTENESGLTDDVLEQLRTVLGDDNETWSKLDKLRASSRDRQLTAVRSAIYKFMPEFSNLRVRRKPRLHMSIDKNGEPFDVAQLSQGEKSLMALIGDIARRLSVMNPELKNPLEGDGIVVIDEVDMHLHPKWQRSLIKQLTTTFPKCQFVLSTHSPLVISDCKNVLAYLIGDEELIQLPSLYGQDANTVLLEIMDTDIRNAEINESLSMALDAIHDSNLSQAKEIIQQLEEELPSGNLELSKAKLLLRKKELKDAQNN